MLQALLASLEHWAPVTALRQSAWAYPLVSTAHLLSLGLLFGSIAVVDLRLLGRLRRMDRDAVVGAVVPVALLAFGGAVLSGMALFAPAGREYLQNPYFMAKLLLIALAGINALALHAVLRKGERRRWWGFCGAASLLLWSGAIFCGRMLAFG